MPEIFLYEFLIFTIDDDILGRGVCPKIKRAKHEDRGITGCETMLGIHTPK